MAHIVPPCTTIDWLTPLTRLPAGAAEGGGASRGAGAGAAAKGSSKGKWLPLETICCCCMWQGAGAAAKGGAKGKCLLASFYMHLLLWFEGAGAAAKGGAKGGCCCCSGCSTIARRRQPSLVQC